MGVICQITAYNKKFQVIFIHKVGLIPRPSGSEINVYSIRYHEASLVVIHYSKFPIAYNG